MTLYNVIKIFVLILLPNFLSLDLVTIVEEMNYNYCSVLCSFAGRLYSPGQLSQRRHDSSCLRSMGLFMKVVINCSQFIDRNYTAREVQVSQC